MKIISLLLIYVFLLQDSLLASPKKLTLVSYERVPYSGKNVEANGFAIDLTSAAFSAVGYELSIKFLPLLRAMSYVKLDKADGILPVNLNEELKKDLLFSDPFPGEHLGLLKRKDAKVRIKGKGLSNDQAFPSTYTVGYLASSSMPNNLVEGVELKKYLVSSQVQSLDMLFAKRVDLSVIDRYTAADLMVSQRPHYIGKLEFAESMFDRKSFHIAFSKSKRSDTLRLAFNKGLKKIRVNGELKRIQQKHGLYRRPVGKKTRLTIGTVRNSDMLIMKKLAREFEKKNPHIELEWRVLEENILRDRLLGDLAISDGLFEVMTIGAYEVSIWAKKGWIVPLQDLQKDYKLDDIVGTVRKSLSVGKELYALPFYAESSMTYYRKDLLSQAGLEMPKRPSYQELKKIAAAIHNPDKGVYGICLRGKAGWGENIALITTMANSFGGRWFDESWNPELNSKPWLNAVSLYHELLTRYGPPNPTSLGFRENLELYLEGRCGLWIDATVAAGEVFDPKRSKVHSKTAYTYAPAELTKKGSHWFWTWSLAIPSSSSHKDEALKFIQWATSQKYIQKVAKANGWISVPPGTRLSTYRNANYLREAPFAKFTLETIETANPFDSTLKKSPYSGVQFVDIPEFPALGKVLANAIARGVDGEISILEALNTANTAINQQMIDSGYKTK